MNYDGNKFGIAPSDQAETSAGLAAPVADAGDSMPELVRLIVDALAQQIAEEHFRATAETEQEG